MGFSLEVTQLHGKIDYANQCVLLSRFDRNTNIQNALHQTGLSINDLVYENSRTASWLGKSPRNLLSFSKIGKDIPLVSFFTGCGGLDLGFEAIGFSHIAAFEYNEVFCNTLRLNRPKWKVFGPPFHTGDVCKVDEVSEALDSLITTPFEGVFIGGPPCQPFSIAANQRFSKKGRNFKRTGFSHKTNGNHLFNFVNLIVKFRPISFVIENVPGLRDIDGGEQLSLAMKSLQRSGYMVPEPHIYDAADYGVPQYRQRMFLVGSRRKSQFEVPNRLEHVGSGSVLEDPNSIGLFNHETRNHKAGSVLRYSRLDYGKREQLGRVDRLNPTKPSKTVIAGGTNGGGRSHLHPEVPRTLTVRECARLQTFPDCYKFVGPIARQFTQVGNAVPPVLGATIATQIVTSYF